MVLLFLNVFTLSCTVGFLCFSRFLKIECIKKQFDFCDKRRSWLWRNTLCSLVHSLLSSIWTLLCYVDEPKLLQDMINSSSTLAISLVMFSTGYFIYDYIDVLLHDRFRQWELLIHHTIAISAFTIAITSDKCIGFAVCSLLMEFNSVFLHFRRLMKMSQLHCSHWYSVNSVFLMLTMVFFRICTSAWMMRWLLENAKLLPFTHYIFGVVGMCIMTLVNIGLMYRLCISEFGNKNVLDLKHELKK